jgi:hypothetical protein
VRVCCRVVPGAAACLEHSLAAACVITPLRDAAWAAAALVGWEADTCAAPCRCTLCMTAEGVAQIASVPRPLYNTTSMGQFHVLQRAQAGCQACLLQSLGTLQRVTTAEPL